MKVAIDISPITTGHYLQHQVRGTGFYLNNLRSALLARYGTQELIFTRRGEKIDKDKVDLIHYPYFEPFFVTLPFRKRLKTIITVHDLTPLVFKKEFPPGVKGAVKWRIQKKLLERSDLIITDSFSSKKDILKLTKFDEKRIKVIYLAAADYFKQVSKVKIAEVIKKFNLPEKFILYVGDATPNKNLARLIEAVNRTPYPLVIVGQAFKNVVDGNNAWNNDLKRAQALAQKNKKIVALGFVEDSDLVSLYNSATVSVMPSLYEGFGLPVLEAMQSGCPVITSKGGSLPEVAGESAFYIDPLSVDSITGGIRKFFSDEDMGKKFIEKGLNNVKKFNWDKTARETYKSYEEVYRGK